MMWTFWLVIGIVACAYLLSVHVSWYVVPEDDEEEVAHGK